MFDYNYNKTPLLYNFFSKNPINIFTVNKKEMLKKLYSVNRISYILTDTNINESNL